jgi:hypothetical protein
LQLLFRVDDKASVRAFNQNGIRIPQRVAAVLAFIDGGIQGANSVMNSRINRIALALLQETIGGKKKGVALFKSDSINID